MQTLTFIWKELLLSTLLLTEVINRVCGQTLRKTPHIKTSKINTLIILTFLRCVPKVEWCKSAVSITKAQQLQRQKQRLWTTIDPLPMQPHSPHIIFLQRALSFPPKKTPRLYLRRNRDICRHTLTLICKSHTHNDAPAARSSRWHGKYRNEIKVCFLWSIIWRIVKGWLIWLNVL